MPESFKVYISSTYKDLKEQREIAARAVRALRHQTVAMEDYTSTEQKPVDKCCSDVKSCDIYLGIFAFRYGHIPKGYQKSITRLEYEAAGAAGIPRLIFLIDEDAPWPKSMMDKDDSEIYTFRDLLKNEHTLEPLKNISDFNLKVAAALSNAIDALRAKRVIPKPNIPALLPYLNNRSQQKDELAEVLSLCQNDLHRKPLVGIIHGDEHECHDKFLEKLQLDLLPELLNLAPGNDTIERLRLNWPSPRAELLQRINSFKRELSHSLTQRSDSSPEKLVEALNRKRAPLLIYTTLSAGLWQKNEPELIEHWLEFWNTLPERVTGNKLLVFLCISYRNTRGMSWPQAFRYSQVNKRSRDFVEHLNLQKFQQINGLALSELKCIPYEELDAWIMKYAEKYCDPEALRYEIDQFYKQQKQTAICMYQLATRLSELCRKTQIIG